ncbi:uncharacterized protein LOC129568518 [Sitodiplosis mosellana]|uniref:uncharacterized protein LOC129568518 n=1 Tax=Sitodiplosis mosellana TaxID=263140 RepID=UPI002443FF9D|nr:uncharacterized protein LOC129568518 [Sitodiplosis mosellana]XP_055302479.1 uncharacterized protein LOC129568518 [Sitodiplosis mosellana]
MNTRKLADENGPKSKAKKLDDQQNASAVDCTIEELTPSIFKLVDDCCYSIFDWLTLKDLRSFGQTCKWAQRVAANFFKMNYSLIQLNNKPDVFDLENVQKLYINSHRFEPYQTIERHCNQPITEILLGAITISTAKVNCLKKVLQTVERVKIEGCAIHDDFYRNFLKLCTNLKVLCVRTDPCDYLHNPNGDHILIGADNGWLTRKYPTLQHLELSHRNALKIDQLKEFFVQNPNVRSFATNSTLFLENWDLFRMTNIKLDALAVRFDRKQLTEIYDNLNTLHYHGVYQRLHWYAEQVSDEMTSLNGLEKLAVQFWSAKECNIVSSLLVNITELSINRIFDDSCMEITARNLVNLERVYLGNPKFEAILSFLRHSTKLKKMKIGFGYKLWNCIKYSKKIVLDLAAWNKEREKLIGARKVTCTWQQSGQPTKLTTV